MDYFLFEDEHFLRMKHVVFLVDPHGESGPFCYEHDI